MRLKLLIVDDDRDLRKILRGILEPLGDVSEAGDGESALEILRRERPGLMLLDMSMPGESGESVLARARAEFPSLCVVMLTGCVDLESARRTLERGARAYITKPFDPAQIRAEIARYAQEPPSSDDPPWRVAED